MPHSSASSDAAFSSYHPGQHIIVEAQGCSAHRCCDASGFNEKVQEAIRALGLNLLGEIVYSFPNGAFTATYCLTESHIAVHTWPEYGRVTFDIFLSNYQQVNDAKGAHLEVLISSFFEAVHQHKTVLVR